MPTYDFVISLIKIPIGNKRNVYPKGTVDNSEKDKKQVSFENANKIFEMHKGAPSVIKNKLLHYNHEKDPNPATKPSTKPIGKVAPFSITRNKTLDEDGLSDTSKTMKGLRVRSFAVDPVKVWAQKQGVSNCISKTVPNKSQSGCSLDFRNEKFIIMPKPLIENR